MTEAEALEEAQRRWGKKVLACRQRSDMNTCAVGVRRWMILDCIKGQGRNWEEAFKDTDFLFVMAATP